MRIEQLLRPVEAYLTSRMAIIRAMDERKLTISDLTDGLAITYSSLTRRRLNSAHWRPKELEKLATLLRIPGEAIGGLQSVALQMSTLPESVRKQLYKEARLDNYKLRLRHEDYDRWQYTEVEWLAATLRTWQDSRKMEILLMDTLDTASSGLPSHSPSALVIGEC